MLWETCGSWGYWHFTEANSLSQSKHTWSRGSETCTVYSKKPSPVFAFGWGADWQSWIFGNSSAGVSKVCPWSCSIISYALTSTPLVNDLQIFFRNKEEPYFIVSELLKKMCSSPKGVEAVRSSPALLKRLHNLVEDLRRKAGNEKRYNVGKK